MKYLPPVLGAIISVISAGFLLAIFTGANQILLPSDWVAPASADQLKNPLQGDASATQEGKKLFQQFCAPCHGNKGKGDGMAGMSMNPRPTNLILEAVQQQSDGAIFWKLTEGRAPMASYKQVLSETKRWQLVNFIRGLRKK